MSYREQVAADRAAKKRKAEEHEALEREAENLGPRVPLTPREVTDFRMAALTQALLNGDRNEALFHMRAVLLAVEKERAANEIPDAG